MRRLIFAVSSLLGFAAVPMPASAAEAAAEAQNCEGCEALLELATSNPLRKDDRVRDTYRHPVETLSFLRVTPEMKVGEYAPGGEWYSRLLGLYLGQQGSLVGLFFNPNTVPFKPELKEEVRKSAAKYPADVAQFTGQPAERFAAYTLDAVPEGERGTFDRILVIRMLHNMMVWNNADSEIKAMREMLKPGGMIGIVQHRAKPDAPYSYSDGSQGYLRQADVIGFMEANGFDLVEASEINANPADSANWPDGVWTLPPTLALKAKDREKYLGIGESDRMTLLFRKRD